MDDVQEKDPKTFARLKNDPKDWSLLVAAWALTMSAVVNALNERSFSVSASAGLSFAFAASLAGAVVLSVTPGVAVTASGRFSAAIALAMTPDLGFAFRGGAGQIKAALRIMAAIDGALGVDPAVAGKLEFKQ